jgi:hypothetical protein
MSSFQIWEMIARGSALRKLQDAWNRVNPEFKAWMDGADVL